MIYHIQFPLNPSLLKGELPLPLIKGGGEGLYKLFSNPKFILWIMLNSLYNKYNGSDGPMGEGRNG